MKTTSHINLQEESFKNLKNLSTFLNYAKDILGNFGLIIFTTWTGSFLSQWWDLRRRVEQLEEDHHWFKWFIPGLEWTRFQDPSRVWIPSFSKSSKPSLVLESWGTRALNAFVSAFNARIKLFESHSCSYLEGSFHKRILLTRYEQLTLDHQ